LYTVTKQKSDGSVLRVVAKTNIGKRIAFDRATFMALDLYARDSMRSFQELADEAFADLLAKHNRPTDLKDALRQSARTMGANDNPQKPASKAPGKPAPRKRK
jgi:hypothetical protein